MKVKLLSCSIFFICTILFSCQKDDLMYSCNPEADAWVKQNISTTKLMTRSSWLELDVNEATKKAAYSSFSADTKKKFWQDKVLEVINQFDWSEKENYHLNDLYDYLNSTNIFNQSGTDDEFDLFIYKWQEEAIDELGWSRKLLYAIGVSGDKLVNMEGDIAISSQITSSSRVATISESSSKDYCTCNTIDSWCDPTGELRQYCSTKTGCDIKTEGCGWFFKKECNGSCRGLGTGD